MRRRGGLLVLVGLGVVVLAIGGGFAFFALSGDDAPPAPTLGADRLGDVPSGRWKACSAGSTLAGYRVNERYLGVGVCAAIRGVATRPCARARSRPTPTRWRASRSRLPWRWPRTAPAPRASSSGPDAGRRSRSPSPPRGPAPASSSSGGRRSLAAFAIEPPSVAGVVTVSDRGSIEFRLRLVRERAAC